MTSRPESQRVWIRSLFGRSLECELTELKFLYNDMIENFAGSQRIIKMKAVNT